MTPFASVVQEWQTFYATIAASSATLVGLLFVALTLNPNTLTRDDNGINKLLARQIFTSFIYLIGIAFTFLIPEQEPLGLGVTLFGVGVLGLTHLVLELRSTNFNPNQPRERRAMLRRSAFKALALAMLVIIGTLIAIGSPPNILWWMIAPILFLLISASTETWVLLVGVQKS